MSRRRQGLKSTGVGVRRMSRFIHLLIKRDLAGFEGPPLSTRRVGWPIFSHPPKSAPGKGLDWESRRLSTESVDKRRNLGTGPGRRA